MINRDYKKFGIGGYYHIYNRGNAKQDIFLDEHDFAFFLLRLEQNLFPDEKNHLRWLPDGAFSLISYCLMPNHFHLLLRQNLDIPTSKLLLKVCTSYSMYFNKKYGRVGHIFQDQFKQIGVENNSYLLWLSAYIHQNPKVAGLVKNLVDYRWSSYTSFIEGRAENLCDKKIILDQFKTKTDYQEFVESSYQLIKDRKDIKNLLLDLNNE